MKFDSLNVCIGVMYQFVKQQSNILYLSTNKDKQPLIEEADVIERLRNFFHNNNSKINEN